MKIPPSVRTKHIYIPGMTRHGKSTLMTHLALHDIKQGYGVCVMDGKGDFIPKFLHYIPENRKDDAIYLDVKTPVPLDFMGYTDDFEKQPLIGELKHLLTGDASIEHAPIMDAVLTDLLYTLFDYNDNPDTPDQCRATFLDIFYFLTDPERREIVLSRVRDKDLLRIWQHNFPNARTVASITSRLTNFVRHPTLRKIFGAKTPKLNIEEVMNTQKILLVNLGPVGEIEHLYGTLLLAKIRQAAMRRAPYPHKTYPRFYLYADEFQEFQTSDFPKMLSQAGGLGLCLTLAHQYVDQLKPDILHAIKGNVSTYICFRLGEESMNAIKSVFPKVSHDRREKYRKEIQAKIDRLLTEKEILVNRLPPQRDKGGWLMDEPDTWEVKEFNTKITALQDELENLPSPADNVPDTSTLPFLDVGEALYRAADGTAYRLHTPEPLSPPPVSYAEYIKFRTIHRYSCRSAPECLNEDYGNPGSKSDDIGAGPEPDIPPHERKKKRP